MYYALMLLQASPDEAVAAEMQRLQRNFSFLNSGLWVAWLVLVVYVLMLATRERKLQREITGLKAMMEDKPRA
jgi:CcmD family protein